MQWELYRQEMIAHAGVGIFIFGNKLQGTDVVLCKWDATRIRYSQRPRIISDSVVHRLLAEELWKELMDTFESVYPEHVARSRCSWGSGCVG